MGLKSFILAQSTSARTARAEIFRRSFHLDATTKILDLGSEDGTNVNRAVHESLILASNVTIADIDPTALEAGRQKFGYNTVLLDEASVLPFPDRHFDIVFCSSVIEHVTVPKSELWSVRSGKAFRSRSWGHQMQFASEIRRIGRQYFVQTPAKSFPIESHTWLPFMGYLPRRLLLPILQFTNAVWIKSAIPDFNLLGRADMQQLFPDARILGERRFGVAKSYMAIRSERDPGEGPSSP
ncbi:MAG TPA: class I SAM-dependent methyltransferase [Devosia sp.]|nr:class I SAM-dependent methyltransferase [Devosia sp.]